MICIFPMCAISVCSVGSVGQHCPDNFKPHLNCLHVLVIRNKVDWVDIVTTYSDTALVIASICIYVYVMRQSAHTVFLFPVILVTLHKIAEPLVCVFILAMPSLLSESVYSFRCWCWCSALSALSLCKFLLYSDCRIWLYWMRDRHWCHAYYSYA